MAKTTTRTKSVRTHWGLGTRGRDADFPSAPIRVSENAQAKVIDVNAARQFDFGRRDREKLPERPSTSGGPAANFSMRRHADKRETRDDLHFNPLAAHGKGTTFYNFPLPGALPTPANTPKSSPPLPVKSSGPRSDTPESMDARPAAMNLPVRHAEIGMALGSPTHQPNSWQQQPQTTAESTSRSYSPDTEDASVDGWVNPPPLKHKASKWKIFGLFGGGKKTNNAQAFYQLQPEVTQQTAVESDLVDVMEPSSEKKPSNEKKSSKPRGRGRTNSERKTEKQKPDMMRANTAPLNFDFQAHGESAQPATPQIMIDGGPMVDTVIPTAHHDYQGGPMLNVDIPSTQMERYSIMFGSVLQKPAHTTTSSALLARRQATLDRLKTVNEALALKEKELEEKARLLRPRRATSPQPTKSPAFSLFPQTPSRLTVREVSPSPRLQRSNTSPAALSPARPTFSSHSADDVHATLQEPAPHIPIDVHSKDQRPNSRRREPKVPPKQSSSESPKQQVKRNWSPEESHLALDSPTSDNGEADVYDPAPFIMKPKLEAEPDWQMIAPRRQQSPPSVTGSTSSRSEGHSTSTSASSISTAATPQSATPNHVQIQAPPAARRNRSATTSSVTRPRPSEVSNTDFGSPHPASLPKPVSKPPYSDEEERLKSAADISIARQISVSRKQRQLLIPIKKSTGSLNHKVYNPNFPSPSPLNITRVASPLGAVAAAAAESPVAGKTGSPLLRVEPKRKNTNERLVAASTNPSTPTLVVVNGRNDEVERSWGGVTAANSPALSGGRHESGEIKVGLAIGSPVDLGNRKSERVIVERVGS